MPKMASGSLSDKSRSLSPFTQRRNWRGVNLINPLQNEKWTAVFGWFSVFETHVRPFKATSYAGELSNRLPSEVCGHQAKIDDNRFFFGRRFSVFYSRVTWFDKSEESREGWSRPPPWCSGDRPWWNRDLKNDMSKSWIVSQNMDREKRVLCLHTLLLSAGNPFSPVWFAGLV